MPFIRKRKTSQAVVFGGRLGKVMSATLCMLNLWGTPGISTGEVHRQKDFCVRGPGKRLKCRCVSCQNMDGT